MSSGNFKPVRVKRPYDSNLEYHRNDCIRIQAALMSFGYYATLEQCAEMWELNSEDMAAGWLYVPEDETAIYIEIKRFIQESD